MTDPDYSPRYQDEYQRLWHEAAARVRELEAIVVELRERQSVLETKLGETREWIEWFDRSRETP